MARPLGIEFPDALHHVTSRGDRREPIHEDGVDRQAFLEVLALERCAACVARTHPLPGPDRAWANAIPQAQRRTRTMSIEAYLNA